MKNKSLLIFALFLFVLLGSILAIAQEPPHSDRRETRKIVDEDAERTYHNQSLSADEVTTLNAIIPDFQVNENAGPNGAPQRYPSISTDGSGNFVITWQDYRNGNSDIYAQRYSSDGTGLESNFRVTNTSEKMQFHLS